MARIIFPFDLINNKIFYKELRKYLAEVFREQARKKECKVMEGHLMPDHVHVMMSILPKYAVAQIIGLIKDKSAIQIARTFVGRKKNFTGQHFWPRVYHISTVKSFR